jgi:hypothetical protein
MAKPVLKEGTKTTIPLDSIREELFVRKGGLDQDHVIQLMLIYDAGGKLPPIQVTPDWVLVDGRHRLEAMRAADMKEAEVEVMSTKGLDKNGLLLKAFEANLGGSLPPKTEDIKYTIKQLLLHGWSERKIEGELPYPKSVAHRYVRDAALERNRDQRIVAIQLLAKGHTLAMAAKESGVTEGELKAALDGARKKQVNMASRKGAIATQFRNLNMGLGKMFTQMMEDFGTGNLREETVWEHLNHALRLAEGTVRQIVDKKKRFETEIEQRNSLSTGSKAVHELAQQ